MNLDIKTAAMLGLAGVVTALFSGKFVRRLLLLPFEYLTRKSGSKVEEVLLHEAAKDLGIDTPTLPPEENKPNDSK